MNIQSTPRSSRRRAGALLGLAVASAALVAPDAASAAEVKLHVQAPYDLKSGAFNLRALEWQNLAPVFHDSFTIPHATIEQEVRALLADKVDRRLSFHITCWSILCPDTDVDIDVRTSFAFTDKQQPKISSVGPSSANTLKVTLDTQVRVGVTIDISTETGIWHSSDIDLDIFALIGGHAEATLTLWPTLDVKDVKVALSHDGGNIEISGLKGAAVDAGVKIGAALGGPLGALLGGVLADLGADEAEDKIKAELNKLITQGVKLADERVRGLVATRLTPELDKARALQQELLSTEIKGVGYSLSELMTLSPVKLDVRTRATDSAVHTVVTTRFDPSSKSKQLRGAIRFPKTRCVGATIKNKQIGVYSAAIDVVKHNEDLAGKSCASLINAGSVRRGGYLGESPEKLLKSGVAANSLESWTTVGGVSTQGVVVDKGGYYECPYVITGLPDAGIIDLGVAGGSELYTRMTDLQAFRARYLYATVKGVTLLLDADGKPQNPLALNFGGQNPTDVNQCPSTSSPGAGFTRPSGFDVPSRYDPEKCPMCGVIDVWNQIGAVTYPAERVGEQLVQGDRVLQGAALKKLVNQVEQEATTTLRARRDLAPQRGRRVTRAPSRAVNRELPVQKIEVKVRGSASRGK